MENVADLMASHLSPPTLAVARAVGAAAEAAQVQPFLVGGSVRDLLLDRAGVVDLDITLVGANVETSDRIASLTGGTISKRSQFTTAKLDLNGLIIDLAMARAEEYPTPGSLPVVRSGALDKDLDRRDFSVNAMAVSLCSDSWGDLLDPNGGLADLYQKRLRVLHSGSFRDDPTRILRAARYSSRLDLTPTPDTLDELLISVSYLDYVSAARVRNELERVFEESDPAGAMRLLCEWRALSAIHPSLRFQAEAWERFTHETIKLPSHERTAIAYAVLAHGLSDADTNGVVTRLNPDASARRAIRESALFGRIAPEDLSSSSNSQLAELLDPMSESTVRGVALCAPTRPRRLDEYLNHHRGLRPHLTGNDLIRMGAPRGPGLGRILKRLRDARLDGIVTTPSEARILAETLIRSCSPN